MKNQSSLVRRFSRNNLIRLTFDICGIAAILWVYAVHKKADASREFVMRSKLGGRVIFEARVEPDTLVIMPCWEGSTLYKTQTVVYTTVKNMKKYIEKPLDNKGWVWYYIGSSAIYPNTGPEQNER